MRLRGPVHHRQTGSIALYEQLISTTQEGRDEEDFDLNQLLTRPAGKGSSLRSISASGW